MPKGQPKSGPLPEVQVVDKKGKPKKPPGRPRGSLNKATLFKDIVALHLEQHFLDNAEKLAEATFKDAIENDGQSRKIIWDRMMPVKKATDMDGSGTPLVNITIKGIEPDEFLIEGEDGS